MKRRQFLKALGTFGTAFGFSGLQGKSCCIYFRLHPFINASPEAVFIMRTAIADKFDSAAKREAGFSFGRSVFLPSDTAEQAFPLSREIVIKPNLTSRGSWQRGYTTERSMGVITDVDFVEGLIEGMKCLGLEGSRFHIREVNGVENLTEGGYSEVGRRTGADVQIISTPVSKLLPEQVVWKEVPNGVWFKKIPYLSPVNAPDTLLLNVAKLKTHGMGVTLCAKNLQGTIAANYQQHCTMLQNEMSIDPNHVQTNAKAVIEANYRRHTAAGIPRWDRPGADGGLWQETWATRCLDNNSTLKAELHIIEGLYAHDGNFVEGPHNGFAEDFLTNLIIFGKNPFHVDIIGTFLAGHEPGNFGLFHLARERGLSRFLDPRAVPLFEWTADGNAVATSLSAFKRTPLLTYYLRRDYGGSSEPYWHLVDEPYDYGPTAAIKEVANSSESKAAAPFPNPSNGRTSIPITLSRSGNVRLEIFSETGRLVAVPFDGQMEAGERLLTWDSAGQPSGVYFYRLLFCGQKFVGRLMLIK